MRKWKVARGHSWWWEDNPPFWVVYNPEGWNVGEFDTHAEAMEYADTMARAATIKVPRRNIMGGAVPGTHAHIARVGTSYETAGYSLSTGGVSWANIRPDELYPLAEALLALHYENEKLKSRVRYRIAVRWGPESRLWQSGGKGKIVEYATREEAEAVADQIGPHARVIAVQHEQEQA